MDNELGANDPYREMNSGEKDIRPEFLSSVSSKAQGVLGAVEQVAALKTGKAGGAAKAGAKSGTKNANPLANAESKEKTAGGLYTGKKDTEKGANDSGSKGLKIPSGLKMAAPFLIILLAVIGIIGVIIALPVMMIGAIDYNLQKALGFTGTVGILEEQAEHVTAELAKSGDFPTKYSSDLASNGVDVGQVTANGDFVKTDVYIANIEERDDLVAAASGFSYVSEDEGELALLYNGEIIRADDFVAKVESDPNLYAAFSKAANISSRYYYGKDVSSVFREMGLSRGSFNDWEQTGDYDTDEASFTEILTKVLNSNDTDLTVGAVHDDRDPYLPLPVGDCWFSWLRGGDPECRGDGTYQEDISEGDAAAITGAVAEKTKSYIVDWHPDTCYTYADDGSISSSYDCQMPDFDGTETKRAAELLNTAVSAKEPYIASSAFMGIEEPIQRARISGDGPVNQLMNTLSTPTMVSYKNSTTGEMESQEISILETVNFQAAVGEKPYDKAEALNFARDRVLQVTDQADAEIIKGTTISSNGADNSSSATRNGNVTSANAEIIAQANDAVSKTVTQSNSSLFQSVIGANRVLEGGSFLSNNINLKVIGAMPSNAETVANYQKEVDETLARKAEAERASLSPFDISSPNTFLGSIAHSLATAVLGSYGSNASSLASTVQATGDMTGDALSGIFGTAKAESYDQKFTAMGQTNCETVGVVEVEGDLYCTSHNTVNTERMEYTLGDWKGSEIGDSIGDDGKILEGSELEQFIMMGMDRESTVGVLNTEVCDAWHMYNDGLLDSIIHFFEDVIGLYDSCKGVDEDVATGAKYSFSNAQDEKLALYSGYMLHDQVYSLLAERESNLALAREAYYAKHPRDNSEAGVIARISGMSKKEAEIALAYADYLNEIASYDASTRYKFGPIDLGLEDDQLTLELHSNKIAGDFVAWYVKEVEFRDLRELTTSA